MLKTWGVPSVYVRDGVAVVPITGPLFRYANVFTNHSGATSIELVAKDFRAALDDPEDPLALSRAIQRHYAAAEAAQYFRKLRRVTCMVGPFQS